MVLNLCTIDFLEDDECKNVEKVCDDGDSRTEEWCDPETGACVYGPVDILVYCWGSDEDYAHSLCDDDDLCTVNMCDFGDEFIPWDSYEDPPVFDPDCLEGDPDCIPKPPGIYECIIEPISCDDMDPCTVDSCDPDEGCIHEKDFDNPAECCTGNLDCQTADLCMVGICDFQFLVCIYQLKNCEDIFDCTIDSCEPETGECIHEKIPDCFEGDSCWTDDPEECDDGNPCTIDYCGDFDVEKEYGVCKHLEVDCDDENECTLDTCVLDGCVNQPDDNLTCDDGDPDTVNACVDGECVVVD
jgi:hypothetical protein